MRWIITLFLYVLTSVPTGWSQELDLHIGKQQISAFVAHTAESREQGLMRNSYLCENCGMLFVFPRSGKYSFWMKDTSIALSIAFIDANGNIINIEEMAENTTQSHYAQGLALYALEMRKNWFASHGIQAKDRVTGLNRAPQGQ